MKKNRSNKFTRGICDIVNRDRDKRFCFFEIDEFGCLPFLEVVGNYQNFALDVLVHRTWHGWHFLSPTMVNLTTWKAFHSRIKHINKECPMTCMRWEPNKYPEEPSVWFNHRPYYFLDHGSTPTNSNQFCNLLNKTFGTAFLGDIDAPVLFVRYPLP